MNNGKDILNPDLQKSRLYNEWDDFFEKVSKAKEAHEKYLHERKKDIVKDVAADIIDSWDLSLSSGLKPFDTGYSHISDSDLKKKLDYNSHLINVADPILEEFASQFSSNLFVISLFDKDFCLLKSYGANDMSPDEYTSARPGAIFSEKKIGCTAMSMAYRRGQATQLIGGEHFSDSFSNSVSTSAIIYFNGEIQGYICTFELIWRKGTRTLGTLIALSKLIENNYQQEVLRHKLIQRAAIAEEMLNANYDAILLTDASGKILDANKSALNTLNIDKSQLSKTSIIDILGKNNQISSYISRGTSNHYSSEVTIKAGSSAKHFFTTLTPIITENSITAYLISLKDPKSIKHIIRSVGGWDAKATFDDIIGSNPLFCQSVNFAKETAALNSNTLIEGESGTGKDLFAQAIHNASNYSSGPFVSVNCGSIPMNLLESELFGYEGGSFTSSRKEGQMGKFELADGGTIFLNEINAMPLDMQVKLLSAIQDKAICRVGGNSKIALNTRIIAASNENLWNLVEKGEFRLDLFYRLNVITIHIPPLSQHLDDIPAIAKKIISHLTFTSNQKMAIADDAFKTLMEYNWPGNVRELENVIERALVSARLRNSNHIESQDLISLFIRNNGTNESIIYRSNDNQLLANNNFDFSEKEKIESCLKRNRYNKTRCAEELNISRGTLYSKIKKYNIIV